LKIGILQTGYPPASALGFYGTYRDAFERLLQGYGFEFTDWACVDGDLPTGVHDADGWLITGSKHGAYENMPWIKPLEGFIRNAYSESVPLVGICFGHQIIAQALGGKVEKFSGGWSIGRVDYRFSHTGNPAVAVAGVCPLYAWHQDQVVELPAGAEVIASTDFCRFAALRYGDRALTMQPHPEFDLPYIQHLLEIRSDTLPPSVVSAARQSLAGGDCAGSSIAAVIADFFNRSPGCKI